ncbi:hypothetical protein HN51_017483 [Arachis hypogaea]|uniref:Uncharacterized protein n=1 Tax=Arachis hypogaea TaxID=3818 RepID=A0A445CXE5_ARAHY|nr:F-box protein At5g07610-like [Arachis ipaensis]XP_025662219.1 F-box protein At5g07610-like [Arachis hypogaea]QHN88651.1 F-box protein [Arachis hypogaea]RYR55607.1 hypothetical protein Ahy_A06g030788 [Arachis hypogaea]
MRDNTEFISSSMEAIERNDDLLTQILVRVPLRDVITFRRVSKRWLSLISAPYFRRCHTSVKVKQRVSGLFFDFAPDSVFHQEVKFFYLDKETCPSYSSSSFSPKIPDLGSSLIIQSCNGLMLLQSEEAAFIYNPTTGDKKTLPSSFPSSDPSDLYYSLAFDPLLFLGYKVICIFDGLDSKDECFQTMIYSSESGGWKRGCSLPPTSHIHFDIPTYFKGSIYWNGRKTTLRFDLKEECMKNDMPRLPPKTYYRTVLVPSSGYMNLAGFESDDELSICIFRLKEDYSSPRWVHMHSIDLLPVIVQTAFDRITLHEKEFFCSVIHLIEDHEDGMSLLLHVPGAVVVLRLKDRNSYYVSDIPTGNEILQNTWGWFRTFEYMESLASV